MGYRIPQQTLYLHRKKGGLDLPHLHKYYLAARIDQMSVIYSRHEKPDLVQIEKQAGPRFTLDYLLWSFPKTRPPIMAPTLSHTFALWDSLHSHSSLVSAYKPLTHLFNNQDFPLGRYILAFNWWLDKGLYRIGHFFMAAGPITLTHCTKKLDLSTPERFRFGQISHFLNMIWKDKPLPPRFTDYELWCGQAVDQKGGSR